MFCSLPSNGLVESVKRISVSLKVYYDYSLSISREVKTDHLKAFAVTLNEPKHRVNNNIYLKSFSVLLVLNLKRAPSLKRQMFLFTELHFSRLKTPLKITMLIFKL